MVFTATHILITAAVTAVVALAAGYWRLIGQGWPDAGAVGVLSGIAVALWRLSANMPALNNDGLPGFSANDLAAPTFAFVLLTLYADLRTPPNLGRYRQARALATLATLAVNVITI